MILNRIATYIKPFQLARMLRHTNCKKLVIAAKLVTQHLHLQAGTSVSGSVTDCKRQSFSLVNKRCLANSLVNKRLHVWQLCGPTFIFWVPTKSTSLCSFRRKRRVMSLTQGGRVALNSRVCMFSDDPPAFRIISTSSTKPMFSISSHSSNTRNLQHACQN